MGLCRGTCIEVTVLRAWLKPGGLPPEWGVLTDSAPPLHLRETKEEKKEKKKSGTPWAEYHMQAMPLPSSCGNTYPGPYFHNVYESRDHVIRSKDPSTNNHAVLFPQSYPISSNADAHPLFFFSRRLPTGTDNCLSAY